MLLKEIGWPGISPTAEACPVHVKNEPTALLIAVLALTGGVLKGLTSPAVCQAGELAKLTPHDAMADSRFGTATAIDGDLAVVGARWDSGEGENAGAAYVFRRYRTAWTETAKLTASDASEFSRFGQSVSVSGDTIVVGAPRMDDVGNDSGAAYVFRLIEDEWTEEDKLTAPDAAALDRFGVSVSIHEDVIVVGSRFDDDACPGDPTCDSGAAYVFRRVGTTWSQEEMLTASDQTSGAEFGYAVSICGQCLVVGSYLDDAACPEDPQCDSGSAYVYCFDGTSWNDEAKLIASDGEAGDRFGVSVSISQDAIVIGAERESDLGVFSGAAYVFHRPENGWGDMSETAKLTASDGQGADRFGASVSIDSGLIIVGATNNDAQGSNAGAAYMYRYNGLYWAEQTKLTPADGEPGDRFGSAVAGSDDIAIIGAPQEDTACPDLPECNSGAAYVFDVSFGEFDLRDYARFQGCFTGADFGGPDPVACLFDFDLDEDVDLDDWRVFVESFAGP